MLLKKTYRLIPLAQVMLLLLVGVMLALMAEPAFASEAAEAADASAASGAAAGGPADSGKSWGGFFGRTHVLWLHLPIGLIIGAFTLEFLGLFKRTKGYDVAAAWLFVLGAGSSIMAVFTGLLLGTEEAAKNSGNEPMSIFQLLFADTIEEGVSETLGWHMWLGITLMVVAIAAGVLKVLAVKRQWKDAESSIPERGGWPLAVARLSLVGAMVAMPFAGHLGGNLVHTEQYLFERAPFSVPDALVYWPEEVPTGPSEGGGDPQQQGTVAFWNANIQPVLNDHCIACHDAKKQNGELRLDTLEWAMKGGSVGGTIEPGDAEFSEIYRRVILPPSHDEFMPTNVKKYGMLNQEEIIMLGEWLTEFDGKLEDPKAAQATPKDTVKPGQPEPVKPLIDPAAVRAIEKAGGSAQSLSLTQPQLSVKFAYLSSLPPDAVANLEKTADQVAWLTFEGSALDDAAMAELPAMPKLTQLNLKDTGVTDAGLEALPELPKLEWLNLFGTKITDAGLEALAQYGSLKKVYVTGTGVSADAVAKLRAALPEAQVFSDHDGQFDFKPDQPEPATEQASAKPVNDKCPVSGAPVKEGFVSTFEGKTVGFCCNNCKGKFDANPKQFAAKLP